MGSDAADESITLDHFRVISDWYHHAILELTFAKSFKPDPRWIAGALGISPLEAKLAIERLLSLGFLEERDGNLIKTTLNLDTKDKSKSSIYLKRRQKQILEKSIHSLENDPIDFRNHSAVTLCVAMNKIPEAKLRIQKFIWELCEFLENGEQERVYELCVNLFPLQKLAIAENKTQRRSK